MKPAVFVDLEASALRNGFPIEVGWAAVAADGAITVESWLVKPPQAWVDDESRWSFESARIHNIPLVHCMRSGKPCDWLAQRMNALFAGATLLSDAPGFDAYWLSQVFREADAAPLFSMADVAMAFQDEDTDERAFDAGIRRMRSEPTPHRAGPDARRWAELYAATRRA